MKTTILIGVLLAVIRVYIGFTVEPESFHWTQAYKDAAHLFMGGLFVSMWTATSEWKINLFWLLTAVEVMTAILSRGPFQMPFG